MQKSCECTWPQWQNVHQLMATQVKSPRKSLATEAAHGFMQDLH
jgi:hypothetical protein